MTLPGSVTMPRQQGLAQTLGTGLGQAAGGSLANLLGQYQQNQVAQKLEPQFGSEMSAILAQMPAQQRASVIGNLYNEQMKQQSMLAKEDRDFGRQKEMEGIKQQNKQNIEKFKSGQQQNVKKQEKLDDQKELVAEFDDLEKVIKNAGSGLNPFNVFARGLPGTKARTAAQRLETEGLLLADKVFTRFNKGPLNREKWKDIGKKIAPRKGLTVGENLERYKALKVMAGLPPDITAKNFDKVLNNTIKKFDIDLSEKSNKENEVKLQKVPQGTKITPEIVQKLYEEYDTPEEARKKALQLGYTIE